MIDPATAFPDADSDSPEATSVAVGELLAAFCQIAEAVQPIIEAACGMFQALVDAGLVEPSPAALRNARETMMRRKLRRLTRS